MATTSATSSTTPAVALSGLASGIDWQSLVTQLVAAERAPETQMQAQQTTYQTQKSAFQSIGTKLTTLQNDINTLTGSTFFDSRTASLSDPTVASATASDNTALGNYTFNITQLASNASMQGVTEAGKALSPTSDVAGVTLATAGFSNPVNAGTFTVDGKTITIAGTDTLQSVFDQINSATGGVVTASYDPTGDKISLTSSDGSAVVLGSATDSSNFLQSAKLYNNGTGSLTSASSLGGVNLTASLASSNLATAVSDGGSGNGQFLVNGVAINYNSSTDSVNDILQRINNSSAGVTATYDSINDRFVLTNKTAGDIGISLQDVTGNFLAATGLSGGALQRGTNLQYNINGGGTLVSQSNTISSASSGITGLSLTALKTGSVIVSVGSDTTKIASAVTSFVNDYNDIQNYLSSQTATSTDSSGNVTPGTLTGNMDVEGIETTLRQMVNSPVNGSSGLISSLDALGIVSNGQDATLSISDPSSLGTTIASNLNDVKNLFTNSTNGIGTSLSAYITNLNSDDGLLANTESNLTEQSSDIDTSIAALEKKISDDQTRMTNEFVAMETAVNTINQQKQYLTSAFGGSSSGSGSSTASGI
jgi:flagellar hook-associated protein 2